MKKTAIVAVIAFCIFGTAAQADSIDGKGSVEAYGGLGLTYPGGTVPNGTTVETGLSYNAGLLLGYGIGETIQIIGGAEYSYKPIILNQTINGIDVKATFQFKYINILAGVRSFVDSFYFEGGVFYGLTAGDQKLKAAGSNGRTITTNMDSKENGGTVANDYGLFIGIGYLFHIDQTIAVDLGCRVQGGISDTYKYDQTKIKTRNAIINLGVIKTF